CVEGAGEAFLLEGCEHSRNAQIRCRVLRRIAAAMVSASSVSRGSAPREHAEENAVSEQQKGNEAEEQRPASGHCHLTVNLPTVVAWGKRVAKAASKSGLNGAENFTKRLITIAVTPWRSTASSTRLGECSLGSRKSKKARVGLRSPERK